ncbi:hypothetical protein BACCAP_01362 [Pseudoflavonifractor capillosus ATCC 29799]|uniref:Uncharacterized protein n=1 Tax=Pseudoflavonifractor capillosus ATCC 29799 TaxID=411467 RepID=A6NT33_9FIRM|nr:hypothetical protein BACCAP_01362 [Pseudoflavonifractor capillosus ATCC 29799]
MLKIYLKSSVTLIQLSPSDIIIFDDRDIETNDFVKKSQNSFLYSGKRKGESL